MKTAKFFSAACYAAGAAMLCSFTCYAYIDPATTSYIVQIAAGVVIALGTVIGIFGNKLKRLFKKKKEGEPQIQNVRSDEDKAVVIKAEDLMDED